ncbi:MAG TPA: maleylpyruvate isomerase family mycothiol-dependent enzyme [Phycicoccus sp.]
METSSPDLLAAIDRHTALLDDTLSRLDPDVGAPTLCEGWTRGHVLSHLARNANGIAALVRAAVDGSGETMYASAEARDADIDAGAGRGLAAQVADVRAGAERVGAELRRLRPEDAGTWLERVPGVRFVPAGRLPFMRLREVVYHHVDLGAGFTFADVDPGLLRVFLDDEVVRLRRCDPVPDLTLRTTEGDEWTVGVGTAEVSGDRAAVLGWLARGLTSGISADPLPRLPEGR